MQAHLFFICPTDHLEPVINNSFKQRNYYYTSLGNSLKFDPVTLNRLKVLILTHDIKEISLILSDSNPIIKDALTEKDFTNTLNLKRLYDHINEQKEYSDILWQKNNCSFTILSCYLNNKIKELRLHLKELKLGQIGIHGKIYSQKENVFNDIYSDLICRDYFSLN